MAHDGRLVVKYTFYKMDPAWRRLPESERRDQKARFLAAFEGAKGVRTRSYSTVGTRGDCDFFLWLISEESDAVHRFHASLNQTSLAGWMSAPYSYLAMTRKSPYVGEHHQHEGQEGTSTHLEQTDRKYLFVYPFVKTHAWYQLPQSERRRMMIEHFKIGHKYPSVKINTTYSFGLDDPEFVLGFESDSLGDFLDLVMDLRAAEQRPYTERDVPIFTGIQMPLKDCLDALG
jgi:chlorite dismutase